MRLWRAEHPQHDLACQDSEIRTAVLTDAVRAEALVESGGVASVAEQARHLAGATSAWLGLAGGELHRAGTRAEEGVARSLCIEALGSGTELSRGDLVAVPGAAEGTSFCLTLRFASVAFAPMPLARATAAWVGQRLVALGHHDRDERVARAELRALRAQISPHFTFNALGAIAATMRLDTEQARTMLLDLADYTRYSFGRHGEYTTLAEELKAVETYLSLERARFGDRLRTQVLVPPEVLGVAVPFLVLQPLVENAVRHGVEKVPGGARVSLHVADETYHLRIEVEDDGPGMDPAWLEARLNGAEPEQERHGFGLRSVDERLRAVYGDEHGLVVETAFGAGTKAIVRIPKYRPEVHP